MSEAVDSTQSEPHILVVLKYLGLPRDYEPSPVKQPEQFLAQYMRSLPQDLLVLFTPHVNAKQRTKLPTIRNRRLRYFDSDPPEFQMPLAKATFSSLWPGPVGNMQDVARREVEDEKEWADREFMDGRTEGRQVGKLAELLGTWTEEREAERARDLRREQREAEEAIPEEEEDTDDEDAAAAAAQEELSPQEMVELFKRRLKERFIYGLLDVVDYDRVDWDENWDSDLDRDEEERWFDDEEESAATALGAAVDP
ncbi:uncharacterized protein PHACADRAFT_170407 [Phanerochaete carnosa HHB-10118-sp]|uniref:CCD97-like C-terminal domain-containing protein n=1 Tax=Phanerochaete carnosa (strain HHB-10118-sp) TaxID=650164 RepID=K5XA73_PHACS|nr:uncharacterized protein PHACADRAFT_170407 [Phanerochaete carnosa HHB-10118-sp]EKM59797.1 hypothetical protein PHACADRAFT_170407 [Phanerochaete carnosa HHB-10118-sp]